MLYEIFPSGDSPASEFYVPTFRNTPFFTFLPAYTKYEDGTDQVLRYIGTFYCKWEEIFPALITYGRWNKVLRNVATFYCKREEILPFHTTYEDGTDKVLRNIGTFYCKREEIFPALTTYEDGKDSVPKRRHEKFRRRGVTQKQECN